jgi:hypothetical protein
MGARITGNLKTLFWFCIKILYIISAYYVHGTAIAKLIRFYLQIHPMPQGVLCNESIGSECHGAKAG